jgi:putative ABC transport system permease protein
MKLAWTELKRRPGRFAVATTALAFLSLLLLFLGALLDGLFLGSTGAIRAQQADVVSYSSTSRDSFVRSRITPGVRDLVAKAPGVRKVGGIGIAQTTAIVPGENAVTDAAVIGFELAPKGVPSVPVAGEAYADRRLEGFGVKLGQTLKVGPGQTPIKVIGFVSDSSFQLQGSLWTNPTTWRAVAGAVPDRFVPDNEFQALIVQGAKGTSAKALTQSIDKATKGATSSLTKADAEFSLPGTKQQSDVFNGIIGTTFAVSAAVVALFFALLTLERIPLYGVLKAMGSSTRQLFSGVVLQSVVVTLIAFSIGALIMFGISSVAPPEFPITLTGNRVITTAVGLGIAAILGSLLSLRRVIRTDPASAIAV